MKNGEKSTVMRKEVLEERQDGEDYAFAIPKRVAASSIVISGAMNIMAADWRRRRLCSPTN
jgi:hypothetical protein